MIRMLNTRTIGGQIYPAGSVVIFNPAIEAQLIASADADLGLFPTLVAQSYAGWTRSSTNNVGVLDTDFVALSLVTIPGGLMGSNSVLRITLEWSYINSTSVKTLALDWGGSNISGPTATTSSGMKSLIEIANKNSLSIQTIQNNNNYGAASRVGDKAVDTSTDAIISMKARWSAGVASETITLIGYSIWHFPGQ